MNGAQDMGGVMGFGPVMPEANEPVFHAKWEKCVFGIVLAMGHR
jgi:nitrile hydratase subunit beta